MLPAVLNVETVPLGVGYGVRFGIRLLGGGGVVVMVGLLPPHPNIPNAKTPAEAEAAMRPRSARCGSIVKQPPSRAMRGNKQSRHAVKKRKCVQKDRRWRRELRIGTSRRRPGAMRAVWNKSCLINGGGAGKCTPQGLKPTVISLTLSARLKSCPCYKATSIEFFTKL